MTVIIDQYTYWSGESWNNLIAKFCKKKGIRYFTNSKSHIDLCITYHFSPNIDPKGIFYSVIVELKHHDRHGSLNKKNGPAGNFADEINQYYLPVRASGEATEIWVFITNDAEIPFSNQKNKVSNHIKQFLNDKKSVEEIKTEIIEFGESLDSLMDFLHNESFEIRDDESLYSFCRKERIPVGICESQQKCLETIYDMVMDLDQPHQLNIPNYENYSNIPLIFERMLRSYSGMTLERINQLKNSMHDASVMKEDWFKWSFDGLSDFVRLCPGWFALEGFWVKFMDMWLSGENPILLKDRE